MDLDKRTRIAILVFILIVLLAGTYSLAYLIFAPVTDISPVIWEVDSIISARLQSEGLDSPDIHRNSVVKQNETCVWEQIEVVAVLDRPHSVEDLCGNLTKDLSISNLNVDVDVAPGDPASTGVQLAIYFEDLPIYQLLLKQASETSYPEEPVVEEPLPEEVQEPLDECPRVALIVDDVGYDVQRAVDLFNLNRPMTISIFPQLKYSRHIAEIAHDMGYEVMMHLPMEPEEKLRRNPGFITPNMTEKEMHWVLDKDLASIPYVIGINNHQGSRMTQDAAAMARLMKYLAAKNLFFVDSRTTSTSVAYEVAKRFGLMAAENQVFLDNEKDVDYITGRIETLMERALENGHAIGICHVHPATTRALEEMFPVIEEEGIELVFVSALVH